MTQTIEQIWENLKKQDNIIISKSPLRDIEVIKSIKEDMFLIKCKAKDLKHIFGEQNRK